MISLIKKIFVFFSLISVLFLVSVISILWIYSNKLPDYKYLKSYKPPVSSKLYSGNGVLVSDFSAEKRIFVPYNSSSTPPPGIKSVHPLIPSLEWMADPGKIFRVHGHFGP